MANIKYIPSRKTTGENVDLDTSNFGTNLSSADDTAQKALDTLDDLAAGGDVLASGSLVTDSLVVGAAAKGIKDKPLAAQTVVVAISANTPTGLAVAEQTLVGRKTGSNIDDLSPTETRAILEVVINSGLADPTQYAISYDASTRQFTVVNSGTNVSINGTLSTPADETTAAHADTTATYWAYYVSGATTLTIGTSPSILTHAIVGRVYYNTDQGAAKAIEYEERHCQEYSAKHHDNQHDTIGGKLSTSPLGCAITEYTLNSDVDANMDYAIATGTMFDEDILHTITAMAAGGYSIAYRMGVDNLERMDWLDSEALPWLSGTYIKYNQNNAGTWQLTELSSNKFVNYYVFGWTRTDNVRDIIIFVGQEIHDSLGAATSESVKSLQLPSTLAPEHVPLYKITYRGFNSYSNTGKCLIRQVQDLRGIFTGAAVDGTAPTNTAAGVTTDTTDFDNNLSGTDTDVQLALETLDDLALTLDAATDLSSKSWFLDQDDMADDDATKVSSQQAIKAFVDNITVTTSEWVETKTYAIQGEIKVLSGSTDMIPPVVFRNGTNDTVTFTSLEGALQSGTNCVVYMQLSTGSGSAFSAATGFTLCTLTTDYTNPTLYTGLITVGTGEILQALITSVSGTPENLSLNLGINHSVTLT